MASEILEGETLGQKHRYYNNLINQFGSKNLSQEIKKINYDEPDIHNLYKIDMAGNKKKVEFILEVLKCEDMLYVSRAIKQSVWLITDKDYAHIINPTYLYSQLLPQMTSKAGHKLILSIRLNLKDEVRVEEFYNYYEQSNELQTALKWLPNCSPLFIENVVKKHAMEIPDSLIVKLCERSFAILEIRLGEKCSAWNKDILLSKCTFLLNKHTEKYLNIINDHESIPDFSPKYTKIIMKRRPDVILNKFEMFANKIDIPTFARFLRPEDIQQFLIKQCENEYFKNWFNFDIARHFIARMPIETRFDFIKLAGIDEICNNSTRFSIKKRRYRSTQLSNEHIYKWYRFARFDIAFADLKKLILIESDAYERGSMFAVLLTCARYNVQNIQAILQYYRDKHINEPFKFKSHFVNIALSHSISHRFDDNTWGILNEIFCSMDVYNESTNNVQSCLKHIIIYKIIKDAEVPDIVEKKFEFDSLKSFQRKLNKEEKEKVFNYLYKYMLTKIQNITVITEIDLIEFKEYIMNILTLLVDWKKDILDHIILLNKIREVIQIRVNKSWNVDLSDIYNVKKSWRKHMFAESLLLRPTQETYINALKHGPQLLNSALENKSLPFNQLLGKLRIYWPQTLAKTFESSFISHLNDKTKHKMAVQGLCILLGQKQLIEIIKEYKPKGTKINWSETDELTLSIQKHFGKYMYLARAQPPLELVLLYATGDYLQYALPSVYSIIVNMSVDRSLKYVPTLLDTQVSLKKHSLKLAVPKLKIDDCLKICLSTWKSNKNASIRATIFKLVFNLLCKERNEKTIQDIWLLLSTLMGTLTLKENKVIYVTLGKAGKVPLLIKQEYCIKTYRYLKTLPPNARCNNVINSVICTTFDVMESLDLEFISEVVFDVFAKSLPSIKSTKLFYNCTLNKVISACLLFCKSQTVQRQRYEKVFIPLMVNYVGLLKYTEEGQFYVRKNFDNVLRRIHLDLDEVIEKNMIMPIKLFFDIHNSLEENLSIEDNYVLILTWKLVAEYINILDIYRSKKGSNFNRDDIYSNTAPEFGKFCVEQLKKEINKYFPSIYTLFFKALNEICINLNFAPEVILLLSKSIQIHSDFNEGHLLVIKMIRTYMSRDLDTEEMYEKLRSHPSAEVRMTFKQLLRNHNI